MTRLRSSFSWLAVSAIAVFLTPGTGRSETENSTSVTKENTAPPNIIFLLADDLRAGTLGCEGNRLISTPNIDSLAAGGVRFSRAYVTTSICSVSRASILSGQYARRHNITNFNSRFTTGQWQQTYPAQLRGAGYYTGFIGKFGVGDAKDVAAMADQFDYWRGKPGQGGPFIDPKDPERIHATSAFGSQALEFIKSAPADKPLCLSVSFTAPHARDGKPREFEPDPRDEKLLAETKVPVPKKASHEYYDALPDEAKRSEGRERWKARFSTPDLFQNTIRDYLRLVAGIDREVGRIRQALEERGMSGNTVIIFTSDNGFFYGERGLADKWLMYEESIHVPLIVYDPRADEKQTSHVIEKFALNIDLAPTMLALAGVSIPGSMQGRSLLPFITGKDPADWRSDFYYEHHYGENRKPPIPATEGVRDERWKYTRWMSSSPIFEELFDLEKDPEELHNLAIEPDRQDELNRLRTRWTQLSIELQ